jgi:hypothetical protein
MGIEPTPQAWEARLLPLQHTGTRVAEDCRLHEPFASRARRGTLQGAGHIIERFPQAQVAGDPAKLGVN